MNDHVLKSLPQQPRMAVEQVWRCFSNLGGLAGLFITGSFARGCAAPDDLDLIAVWDRPITDDERRSLVQSCRGHRVADPDTDRFHLHGVVPEFHFMAGKQQVAEMIANFCWRGEPPPESDADRAEGLLASLVDAMPAFDPEGLAHQWQKMLCEEYPADYQVRRVYEQFTAACRRLAGLCRCGRYRDLLYLIRARLEFAEHIIKAIVSVNRGFYWGPKWTQQQLATLAIKPANVWPRICNALTDDAEAAPVEMRSLAVETGEIIRRELPEVNVEFSMNILQHVE
jgi:hypothetical protein